MKKAFKSLYVDLCFEATEQKSNLAKHHPREASYFSAGVDSKHWTTSFLILKDSADLVRLADFPGPYKP